MNIYIMVGVGGTGVIPATEALYEKLNELKGKDKILIKNYGKGNAWEPDKHFYPFRIFRETLNLILDNRPKVTDVIVTGPGVVKNLQIMLDNMLEHNISVYYFKQKDMAKQVQTINELYQTFDTYNSLTEAEKPAFAEAWSAFAIDVQSNMQNYYSNVDEWTEFGGWDNDLNPIAGTSEFLVARG
jgi:hypothetical protein